MKEQFKGEAGFTIIGAVVAAAIFSIVAIGMLQVIGSQIKAQEALDVDADRLLLKRMIVSATACDATITQQCSPGTLMPLIRRTGGDQTQVFVSDQNPGTKLGKWTVRAECSPSGEGIVVRATLLKPGGTLTTTNPQAFRERLGDVITWTDERSKVFGELELCPISDPSSATVDMAYANIEDCENSDSDSQSGVYEATATCPAGSEVISGGVTCAYPGQIRESYPSSGTTWYGSCCGVEDTTAWPGGKVHVICR